MTQHIQPPSQRGDWAAARANAATLARRQVLLRRRHQEAVATARAVCHQSQLLLARERVWRQRRQGQQVGPLAWFAVQGVIDQQVVRAVWNDGRLCCDRLLGAGLVCWSTWAPSSAATIPHAGTTRASRPRRWRCC